MSVKDARAYRAKCEQFRRAALRAEACGDGSAAGLNAVHAAIAASDAVTSFHLGERSRSKDHSDAVALLRRVALPDAGDKATQLGRILSVKNLAAYEAREMTTREAGEVVTRMERFVAWAFTHLP